MQDHKENLARHPSAGMLGVNCQTGRASSWWGAGAEGRQDSCSQHPPGGTLGLPGTCQPYGTSLW